MKYIALTIGPIYKTLKDAKKPKELFSSSYIFSYIMKKIIKQFKDRKFITPYVGEDAFKEDKVGLFHDRFIFESKDGDLTKLEDAIDSVISDVADKLDIDFESAKEYLQINYLEKELEKDANPIKVLMPYLDTKELFFQISQNDDFIKKLRRKKGDRDNFLTENKNIIDDLKKLSFNEYYCIVHADGDKMSKVIEDIANLENVSKELFNFCINSYKQIQNFGGQTIYAGGDDLLFFAPVVGKDGKNIFELCKSLAEDFETNIKGATLSLGISIKDVKYPLYEALENSRYQLFVKAKNEDRNNIAFCVTKHRGQSFESIVHKGNEELYKKFLNFIDSSLSKDDKEKINNNFLHSIHHKIKLYENVLNEIADDKKRLRNFFNNYFNESGHNEYREFFESLVEFIYIAKDLNLVYATLRFIKFVKGDK
jgi:CRISPR-associated protein Cmr2